MAYKSSAAYADEIVRMANQPETMYKMGLISHDEMLDHNACPLKYKRFIGIAHDKYTYDNMRHIDLMWVNWVVLSLKTDAKIILAHCNEKWVVRGCAHNKSFSFHEFETLMKFKKSFASVIHFHTITSSIVTKYKSYFVEYIGHSNITAIYNTYGIESSLSIEVFDDHPDIFHAGMRRALLPHCRDFDLSKCDDPQQVVNDALSASDYLFRLHTVNHIWEYITATKDQANSILGSNRYITIEVVNKYLANHLKGLKNMNIYNYYASSDVHLHIVNLCSAPVLHIRYALMKNENLTWKDMQSWTIANASVKYEDTNAGLLCHSGHISEDD
jgi:hypothetical protein